jgi:hypothetical protein
MTSSLGPLGPGFFRNLGENSITTPQKSINTHKSAIRYENRIGDKGLKIS